MTGGNAGQKSVIIVGAGPGGLTAAMILAHRGFKVTVIEKRGQIGGRNGELKVDGYSHDIGPTFLMMKFLLDSIFEITGRSSDDYMDFRLLDPMYELVHQDFSFLPSTDPVKMRKEIGRVFPGEEQGFDRFMERERVRFEKMYPCLQKPYSDISAYFAPVFLKALPHLALTKSLYQVLAGYYVPEELRISFTFQSKYLGMSPWSCPGAFSIIPYIEYGHGVYHVQGGLCRISDGMARAVEEEGGEILLDTPVKRVIVENRVAKGVELEDGTKLMADDVIINADFAHAMSTLADPADLKKYTDQDLRQRGYSCSTYMLYLGLDKLYDTQHHTIVFAEDYQKNLDEIANQKVLSEDISFYVRNSSVTDPLVAPEGHSSVYVLVPVPNNKSGIDWEQENSSFREQVLTAIEDRTQMTDLRQHIGADHPPGPLGTRS
ncbi:phytoene desaturase family protein [Gemmatimonadota bacterium]